MHQVYPHVALLLSCKYLKKHFQFTTLFCPISQLNLPCDSDSQNTNLTFLLLNSVSLFNKNQRNSPTYRASVLT